MKIKRIEVKIYRESGESILEYEEPLAILDFLNGCPEVANYFNEIEEEWTGVNVYS